MARCTRSGQKVILTAAPGSREATLGAAAKLAVRPEVVGRQDGSGGRRKAGLDLAQSGVRLDGVFHGELDTVALRPVGEGEQVVSLDTSGLTLLDLVAAVESRFGDRGGAVVGLTLPTPAAEVDPYRAANPELESAGAL